MAVFPTRPVSRKKPGHFARRLRCTFRVLAYTVGALVIGAYLLIYISPMPPPPAAPPLPASTKIGHQEKGSVPQDDSIVTDLKSYRMMP